MCASISTPATSPCSSSPSTGSPILGKRTKNVHLKEFTKKGTDYSLETFRPLLDGTTNWPAVIEALAATGYKGFLTFEYFHPYPHYPEALIYQTSDSLDRILGQRRRRRRRASIRPPRKLLLPMAHNEASAMITIGGILRTLWTMNPTLLRPLLSFCALMIATASFAAATAPIEIATVKPGTETDFQRDVYPILKANCIACHNKTTTKADLNMETPELMKKGGETGPGIVPGKAADSIILQAAAHTWDSIMPPKGNKVGSVNLTPQELGVLKAWIDQGAKSSVKQVQQIAWQALPPGLNPIYSVAMTKDGRFAACSRANQIFVYDLATRQFVTRLTDDALIKQEMYKTAGVAHRDLVQSLAFSPDGTRLASGSFREVKIWRQEKAKPAVRKGDAALGAVVSRLSGDGKQIICGDKAGAIQVLDAASGKVIKTIPAVSAPGIKLIGVSPDSSKAVVYGNDAALAIWNLQDGKRIAVKPGVAGVRAVAWTRDGKAIATAGEDKIVRVWPLPATDGAELAASKELKGATGTITVLESGTGPDHLLSAGEDNVVRLWSIAEAKVAREFKIAGAVSLALSADGKQLAAGCADGAVRIWDALAPKQLAELRGDADSTKRMAALDWEIAAKTMDTTFQTAEIARIDADTKALDDRLKKSNDAIAAGKKALPDKQKAVKPAQDAKVAAQKAADDVTAACRESSGRQA